MLNPASLEQGAVADYLDHFGLQEDPFLEQAGELFDGANRRDQFEQLVHLCQFSTSVLAVVGERGMGKSVFKRELLQRIDDNEIVVDMAAPVLNDPQQLLIDIAHSFELRLNVSISREAPEQVIDQLVELIGQYGASAEEGDPLKILVIDEAHQLDEQSLSALMRIAQYQDEDHRCLHIILFGENMFGVRLVQCAKQDQMVQVFHLETFSRDELRAYLRFRLDQAGFSGIFPFSDEDIHFLHDVSQGIPSAVHEPAREILIEMAMPEPEVRRLGLPLPHMAIIVVLAAGLLLLLLLSTSGDDEPNVIPLAVEAGPQSEVVEKSGSMQNTAQPSNTAESPSTDPVVARKLDQPVDRSIGSSTGSANDDEFSRKAQLAAIPSSEGQSSDAKPKASLEVSSEAREVLNGKQPAPTPPASEGNVSQDGVSRVQVTPPTPPVLAKSDAKPAMRNQQSVEPQSIEAAMLADAAAELYTVDERRLLDTPADRYTLQVLSGTAREAVDDYIVRQSNQSQLRVYSARRNGKVVYIVVAGVFPTLELAREAVKQLPDVQRKAGAWPRQLSSVHKDINALKGQP